MKTSASDSEDRKKWMAEAIRLSHTGMRRGEGGPFGAVIIRNGKIIARAWNRVLKTNDPTAHAEVNAIRAASAKLRRFDLSDCDIYTSCEPCPMCLGAIYWAKVGRLFYANTKTDAARIGFADQFIYQEIDRAHGKRRLPTCQLMRKEAATAFAEWRDTSEKTTY